MVFVPIGHSKIPEFLETPLSVTDFSEHAACAHHAHAGTKCAVDIALAMPSLETPFEKSCVRPWCVMLCLLNIIPTLK